MSETKTVSYGTSLSTLLTVAFIVLKLCNVISWSWWWVVSPILISLAIGLICIIIGTIGIWIFNHSNK